MSMDVLSRIELTIATEDDVVVVRRRVRALAQDRRFDSFAVAAVTTATSELTRNTWLHGGGGAALIEEVSDGGRVGLRVTFSDTGPGIADVQRVLAGGYSSTRTMGLGVSGSRRLVDDFSLESTPGKGTVVTFVKWKAY